MATRPPDTAAWAAALRSLARGPKRTPRRRARRAAATPPPPAVPPASRRVVDVLVTWPAAGAPLAEVLAAAGVDPAEASGLLRYLELRALAETWHDPATGTRVMLGTAAIRSLGLVLSRDGRRWTTL